LTPWMKKLSRTLKNEKLKRFVDVKEIPDLQYLYKLHSKLDINAISTFFRGRRYIPIDVFPSSAFNI